MKIHLSAKAVSSYFLVQDSYKDSFIGLTLFCCFFFSFFFRKHPQQHTKEMIKGQDPRLLTFSFHHLALLIFTATVILKCLLL